MIFKTVVATLFTLSGLASALAATPAYYIAEFQATDLDAIKPYSAQVESTFRPFGGRFIVRGGEPDVKEGFGAQGRLVVIKFESLKMPRTGIARPHTRRSFLSDTVPAIREPIS